MLDNIAKIWAIFTPDEKRKSISVLLMVILMAAAETAGVLSIMPFLAVLGRPAVIHENPSLHDLYLSFAFKGEGQFIAALGLASIVLVIASSVFKAATLHRLNRFIHLERHSLSARLLARYLAQPYEFFLSHNSSALTKNVLSEVDHLLFEFIQPLSQMIAQGSVVVAMMLLILSYDPLMAFAITATLSLLYGTIYWLARKRLARIGRERQAANTLRYRTVAEALTGIKDVKITHSEGAFQSQFNEASRLYSRHMATSDTLSQSPLYLVEATGYTMLIVVALVLMVRSNDIALVLPALGLYGFAAYRMLPAAQIMYRGFAKLRVSSSALSAIHHDLMLSAMSPVPSEEVLAPQREIRMRSVRYAYPSSPEKPIIEGMDLALPAHRSIGITGKSGSGKSTFMDVLMGLLTPGSGALLVDGVAIDASNEAAWQRAIGYVPQHIFLADASVAENIAFGVPSSEIDMEAVEGAAQAAQIHEFIVKELPDGYATRVGDRGIRLSGGQRQRVGIARALYRDPPVLLLDEATSALDVGTEEALMRAVRNLAPKKTVIAITHRESSIRDFDVRVSFLAGGRVECVSALEPRSSRS